jgi:glycosyltransferase involved in cell wall biosynthesis
MSKDAFEVNRMSVFAEKFTYKKRHTIIGVSQQALNDYNKWIGIKGKSFVLYNYVKQSFFDANYDYNRDIQIAFRLVAVGNLRRQKNYFALLEAIHLLKDHPIHLDIYGSGDLEKELLDKINKDGLNVRLMGRTNDVSAVLPAYHAYIMPSLFEGFGIAPMEAMAAGMPVLLSNLEVFKEVAEDFPIYFDPANPSSMADAIKYAYDNWQQVKSKAQKGKSMIKQKVSREVYFSNLIKIYNS